MNASFLKALVAEGDGNPSTMRVATLLVVLIVMGGWLYTVIHTGQMQPLSTEQVGAVLGALGIKAWQRGKEETTGPQGNGTTGPK